MLILKTWVATKNQPFACLNKGVKQKMPNLQRYSKEFAPERIIGVLCRSRWSLQINRPTCQDCKSQTYRRIQLHERQ